MGLLGQLDSELFRARRLVVDTGIHAKHWTRQQAIDYGIEASEIERYVVNPGQACSYMMGELKLLELRDKAKKALGDKFNIRDYHSAVLQRRHRAARTARDHRRRIYEESDDRRVAAEGRAGRARVSRAASPPAVRAWDDEDSRRAVAARRHVVVSRARRADPLSHAERVAAAEQVLGDDWSGGGGGAGGGTGAPPRARRASSRPAAAAPGHPSRPARPATSSQPVTHRITERRRSAVPVHGGHQCVGGRRDAASGITASPGHAELTNRWFRAYRIIARAGPEDRGRTPLDRIGDRAGVRRPGR